MVKLTSMVKTSGCAAKLPPDKLHQVLSALPQMLSPRLLEGYATADDALVYVVKDDIVAIETVDFFPPMVDDPYTFGAIAAANALSDIYAMGAEPSVCMNLMCFPSCLDLSVMEEILRGGMDMVSKAGAVIAGGHTIADPIPKYGLCVTGFATKDSLWLNKGAQVGDVLVLTKALGVGLINTAIKAEMAPPEAEKAAIESMMTLNKAARDAAYGLKVHAATDITGFSLLGHGCEMASASGVTLEINSSVLPILPFALEAARLGLNPEGRFHNEEYLADKVSIDPSLPLELRDLLYDPQTSGGLLFSLPEEDSHVFMERFNDPSARIIGHVVAKEAVDMRVQG